MSVVFCQKILCIYWYDHMIFVFQLIFAKSFLLFLTQFAFFPDIVFSFIFYVYSKFYCLFCFLYCCPILLSSFFLHEFCLYFNPFSVVKLYNINFYVNIWTLVSWNSFSVSFSKIINCCYPECCAHHSYVVWNNLLCKSLSVWYFGISHKLLYTFNCFPKTKYMLVAS